MKSVVYVTVLFIVVLPIARAETAVTVNLTAGPALTEQGLTTVEMIVPSRPLQATQLNVGDKVFFTINSSFEGEGTITNIYDNQQIEVNRAVVLDHVNQ